MTDKLSDALYKIGIQRFFLEFPVDSGARDAELFHDTGNRDSASLDSFLQYFTLVSHRERVLQVVIAKMYKTLTQTKGWLTS